METKYAERGVRLSKIRELFCNGKNTIFADKLGISDQNASSYCNGKTAIGDKLLERVLEAFPRVNRVWLYLGEGDILKPDSQNMPTNYTSETDSSHISGTNTCVDDVNRLITIIENKDRQMERLIRMLEFKMGNGTAE